MIPYDSSGISTSLGYSVIQNARQCAETERRALKLIEATGDFKIGGV
jgi:hypothetical protein